MGEQHWANRALDRLQADPALNAVAEFQMQDYCRFLGGPPADPVERLMLRCAFDVSAERMLKQLLELSPFYRNAIAARLRKRRADSTPAKRPANV